MTSVEAMAFDLDDTLAASKAAISPETAAMLGGLLSEFDVCIISGGTYTQFVNQVIGRLDDSSGWSRLHLMPTSGASHYVWTGEQWSRAYAEELAADGRAKVTAALEQCARDLGLWEAEVWGDRIEDRGSQITFSALGQRAPLDPKRAWDPDGRKKAQLRDALQPLFPELEVRSGGSTSVDVTRRGIDKAFGVRRFMEHVGIGADELAFFGDRLDEGGNDYPVSTLGVRCIAVDGPDDTLAKVAALRAELNR